MMKMKKGIPFFAATMGATLALCACFGGPMSEKKDPYAPLNDMLGVSYSEIALTVTDDFGGGLYLKGEYTLSFGGGSASVSYRAERFLAVGETGTGGMGEDDPFSSLKTTLTGSAAIENGSVTSVQGDPVEFPALLTGKGLSFKEEYFENAAITEMVFSADVKDAAGFLGTPIDCSDMSVQASYIDFFLDLTVRYTSESGDLVEYVYVFTL